MEKTKESPKKYICSNPNILPGCSSRKNNRCHCGGECHLKEDISTIVEKEPITYTEEEVLELLNNLNDLLEEKQYISNINEGVISTSNMSSKEINELNKREEYIQSITNDNFKIDVRKWFEQNKKK